MTIGDFLSDFWWLIFPIFGMYMAVQGSSHQQRRTQDAIALIKSYTDQGKEPPPELLQSISKSLEAGGEDGSGEGKNGAAWTFIIFLALAAGFGSAWYVNLAEDFNWAFLAVAITMGVMAVGAFFILLFGRK